MQRITNIHSHVFTGTCAPDYFLKTILPVKLHGWAEEVNWVLRSPWMRQRLENWAKWRGPGNVLRENSKLLRYIRFLEVGTQNSQEEVFLCMKKAYTPLGPDVRFVALTLNMDHMDVRSSHHARIEDQLAEVERVRAHYPDVFLPFVCVDPRHLGGAALREWVREKIERRAFVGIKMYPAMGFFPFDTRLDELYAWAAENAVPVMTHCTRVGTFYTGRMSEVLTDLTPAGLNPGAPEMTSIHERIARFRESPLTWNGTKFGCNIFLHPENYRPVLRMYPALKICFAHFGGDDEMLNEPKKVRDQGMDPTNWHDLVKKIMAEPLWPHVYTDISYTLFNDKVYDQLRTLIDGPSGGRILYGTDFFMTVREDQEAVLLQRCIDLLTMDRFRKIGAENTTAYLRSKWFNPDLRFT